jgi:Superinfection immunity protein
MRYLTGDQMTLIWWGILLVIGFLPTIIAMCRNHRNWFVILLLNLFTSWTGLGWFIALIWACWSQRPKEIVIVQTTY